ncbi:MAG: hypothetical protein P8Y23_04870 [Candidatus Lokiarchaeota archaeon]|jgi:hypothetical protein
MGFGKAFGFSLIAFVGINFLFVIITKTITGDLNNLFSVITTNPLVLLFIFFGPIISMPGTVINSMYVSIASGVYDTAFIGTIITFIGYIVSPFIASLIAGKTGENKGGSLGGWFLTAIISSLAIGLLVFINPLVLSLYGLSTGIETFVFSLLGGVVNGIFYGMFALLFTRIEPY